LLMTVITRQCDVTSLNVTIWCIHKLAFTSVPGETLDSQRSKLCWLACCSSQRIYVVKDAGKQVVGAEGGW